MSIISRYRTDVAIIGAGPAGSSCAKILSENGIPNILLEKKRLPGTPVQCAEFVPLNINQYIDLKAAEKAVSQRINYMDVDTGINTYRFEGKGFMLNRENFDLYLANFAAGSGSKLMTGMAASTITKTGNRILVNDTIKNGFVEIDYKYLVIANGAKSFFNTNTFKTGLRLKNSAYIYAVQVRTDLLKTIDSTLIYFRHYIPYGYGWVFPKNNLANVGIGIEKPASNMPLNISLDIFLNEVKKAGIIGNKVTAKTAGLVPLSGLNEITSGNIALCGDAAGLTHPITGAGILSAVISGLLLGETLSKSLKCGNNLLNEYKEELVFIFGNTLSKAQSKRQIFYLKKYDNLKPDEIDEIVKRTWPPFSAINPQNPV